MENFVAFALKDKLADRMGGLSAQEVCKNVFLTIGAVHRTESILANAWKLSLRPPPGLSAMSEGIPKADDPEMTSMIDSAQSNANEVFNKLRAQKQAAESLVKAKEEAGDFNADDIQEQSEQAPDLPNSDDMDISLLATSAERVRLGKRVGITTLDHLNGWGHAV